MLRMLPIITSLLSVAGTTWLTLILLMARARVRPPRLTALRALITLGRAGPADLGLPSEPIIFNVRFMGRPVQLNGAFVPHPAARGRLVIVLHGFADSSAGAAAWLPMLHDCKVNVLLLDLPGHGESGDSITTAGFYERHTVAQVIEMMRTQRPDCCRTIALFGISMGAATALATARLPGTAIAGVIADSPYAELRSAAVRHAWLLGLPGAVIQTPATWVLEHWLKIDYSEVAPFRTIDKTPCPVLLIQSGKDVLISREDAQAMHGKLARRGNGSRTLVIENAPHILGLATDPAAYSHSVASFLAEVAR